MVPIFGHNGRDRDGGGRSEEKHTNAVLFLGVQITVVEVSERAGASMPANKYLDGYLKRTGRV